ncbi:phage tail assembly protein [Azospirillum halopraeferens]|uniref:phage tail assembly protein n=1 Tax=Azospirillum halopraeferens TaxID=34010 RepID=UPI0004258DF0|nr:phage tail assembly protein [Azospirillum halopraeferens]
MTARTDTDARTVTLPGGRVACIRKGKGRDLLQAARMAGGAGDGMKLTMAIIAVLTVIDGRPLVIEDVEEMDMADVMVLMGAVTGNGASSLSSISLPSGSTEGSPTPS